VHARRWAGARLRDDLHLLKAVAELEDAEDARQAEEAQRLHTRLAQEEFIL
jgi:hypothetical protein